jgi:hypothetical protein
MGKKKKHKKKKSNTDWLQQALVDLIIGIILLILDKLFDLLKSFVLYHAQRKKEKTICDTK